VTPGVIPADQRRRPRQLSLAGDLARRDVSERLGREAEPARRDVRPRRQPIGCSDGGGPTLENLLSSVWEGLLAAGVADCPVCGAEMRREGTGGGACVSCGSKLG
jgi:hypothetical protein